MNELSMKYLSMIFVLIWISTGCTTSRLRIEGKNLNRYIEESRILGNSFSGFILYDPEKKEIIHEYHGHRFFTPASNTKILTFYTAGKILGDSIPSLAYAIKDDTLYFSGLGDPSFLHPDFQFQPGLQFLEKEPWPLVYVPAHFEEKRFGPGWAWDDFPYDYSAEKSTFPLYGNRVLIRNLSQDSVVEVIPGSMLPRLRISPDTSILLSPGDYLISRDEYANQFELVFHPPLHVFDERIPFMSTDSLVKVLLEDTLKKEIRISDHFPGIRKKIIRSQPTDSLLKPMMIESDNFFAEQLLMMSSWVLCDTLSTEKAIDFALLNFFPDLADEMYWVDGSGLSRYNQLTPYVIARILGRIYSEMGMDYLTSIFPAACVSCTLKKNFPGLEGFVYAKTGSMSHVYNLSGFLQTQKGRWLIFSFMNNNFVNKPAEIRKEMIRILLSVRNRF